ncbi:T9SS type A sorting domain-containing protein [Ekhidna sp.]|uniref:T9SS type A sorting domain-containing protein n=1 Tax=Ekhidna sp. TaxID=2608089 RepID=UPI0035167045
MSINLFFKMGVCLLVFTQVHAQSAERQVIASAGASDTKSSFTVGEVVVSGSGAVGTATIVSGFIQPLIEESEPALSVDDVSTRLSVYPNPSSDFITIAGKELALDQAEVSLFTLDGKRKQFSMERGKELRLDIRQLPPNVYWLLIRDTQSDKVASFKLIKN